MEPKAEKTTKAAPKAAKTEAAPAKKAAAPAAPKKTAAAKPAGMITVVQHGSTTGVKPGARETLAGLGLGKTNARRQLQDTPAIRGMILKVRHLVHVEGEACCKCGKK